MDLDVCLLASINNLLGFPYLPTLDCMLSLVGSLTSRNKISILRDFVKNRGVNILRDAVGFIPMHLRGHC